jgi:hypothetical protein
MEREVFRAVPGMRPPAADKADLSKTQPCLPTARPVLQRQGARSISLMKFTTTSGRIIDTDRDLTAPERHILQKLFLWEAMAASLEEFRAKRREAVRAGWNDSGPVTESGALKIIIRELENKVSARLDGAR